jgi:ATP-dependent Clp endopeptidase proteolytic subunit ClpP
MQPPENAKDWFRIENSAEDAESTDIYVYDSIGGWFGMYADEFIEALGGITTSKINLRLNSPGGSVFEGIAIANAIRSHPANVTVYVDSLAASIASVIALAGDRVVMMPQAQFMIHNASGAEYGQASDLRKTADLLDKQSLNIAQAYAQHTGRPLAEWQALMEAETWFTAEEAVEMGLADELIPMRPAKQEASASVQRDVMNRTWDLTMYRYAGRANAPAPSVVDNSAATPEAPAKADDNVESIANMTRDELVALIRDVVTTAMAPIEPGNEPEPPNPTGDPETPPPEPEPGPAPEPEPTNAFPPPKEDEEEPEDATSEEMDDESDPEDADKKLPPFLQPDEDEEEEEDEPKDEWSSLVARLTTPSPSADDVFMSLKEAW